VTDILTELTFLVTYMCQKLSQSVDIGYVYVVKVTACGRCELFSGTQCSCRVANQINLHIPDDSPGGSRLRTAGDLGGELGHSLLSNFTIFEALDHRRRLSSCTSVHHTRTIYRGCANKKNNPTEKKMCISAKVERIFGGLRGVTVERSLATLFAAA